MQNNIAIISQRWRAARKALMPKAGAVMMKFTDDRFQEQGWKDAAFEPWVQRKNNVDPGRAILIRRGILRRGNRIVTITDNSVTAGNDVAYAKVHNDGFNGIVTVGAHTRKVFEKSKQARGVTKKGRPRMQTVLRPVGDIQVKSFTRHMNITRRRFMGESQALRKSIKDLITDEVNKCFK